MFSFKAGSSISFQPEGRFLVSGPMGTISILDRLGIPLSSPPTLRFLPSTLSFTPLFATLRSAQVGVSVGYYARLFLNGVGFRGWSSGRLLLLDLGYTNLFVYTLPPSVVPVVRRANLLLFSPSLAVLHTVVSQLKRLKPVDPYKGKGVRVAGDSSSIILKKRKKDGK